MHLRSRFQDTVYCVEELKNMIVIDLSKVNKGVNAIRRIIQFLFNLIRIHSC